MVYTVGTERELSTVENKLPRAVFLELFRSTVLLDYASAISSAISVLADGGDGQDWRNG